VGLKYSRFGVRPPKPGETRVFAICKRNGRIRRKTDLKKSSLLVEEARNSIIPRGRRKVVRLSVSEGGPRQQKKKR